MPVRRLLFTLLVALGWIVFAASCLAASLLRHLEWRREVTAICLGPLLMFLALLLRRRSSSATGPAK